MLQQSHPCIVDASACVHALKVCQLQAQHHYSPLVMIGDGATDLEARQEGGADLFIGYE